MSATPETPPFGELPVLITGATGYIGARLVPRLLEAGYSVRCLARYPGKLASRHWSTHPRVTIVQGDLASSENMASLMRGCGAAFYLAHPMASAGDDDAARDAQAARRFVTAASEAGIARIIYLGGLGDADLEPGTHRASRGEVAQILAGGNVPVTVFRAAMIIGSGSAWFEILRYLVERLPVMFVPMWVSTESQPIAVRNVLHYLVTSLAQPQTVGRELDIGGIDIVSFRDLIRLMAEARGLPRRVVVPLPVMHPRLSASWIELVTPMSRDVALTLAASLRRRMVCRDEEAARLMPQRLLTAREAIDAALRKIEQHEVESIWSAAGAIPGDPDWAGGNVFVDRRSTIVNATEQEVFRATCRVGGSHGWYGADLLWRLRGWLDELAGGPGLKRARRNPDTLDYGEAVDFWRVTAVDPGRHLRLRAEMKLPGEALLEFTVEPVGGSDDAGPADHVRACRLEQTATFLPRGLLGLPYWYVMVPFHAWIFNGMLRGIRRAAEKTAAARARDAAHARDGGPHTT
ncbi:MAG: SDR family oxidoreductase [Acidobacteriota bacterium]